MKKFNMMLLSCILGLASLSVWADPAPFGLEVGKATIQQAKSKYKLQYDGINKYTSGKMYDLPASKLGFSGLKSAMIIFNKKGFLVAMILRLDKYRFESVYQSLSKKYHLVSKVIPFVGSKKVVFKDGNTEIELSSPHLSFEMSLTYINNDFNRAYQTQVRKEADEKRQREQSQL